MTTSERSAFYREQARKMREAGSDDQAAYWDAIAAQLEAWNRDPAFSLHPMNAEQDQQMGRAPSYDGLSRSWLTHDSAGRETLPVSVCPGCFAIIDARRLHEHTDWHLNRP